VAIRRIETASTPSRSISSTAAVMIRSRVSCILQTYTVRPGGRSIVRAASPAGQPGRPASPGQSGGPVRGFAPAGRGSGAFVKVRTDMPRTQEIAKGPEPLDDKQILGHIDELIQTEHELRARLSAGELSSEEERVRLRAAEEALDQCWDLLRQRRARRDFGESPDDAGVRPVPEVEGYLQ